MSPFDIIRNPPVTQVFTEEEVIEMRKAERRRRAAELASKTRWKTVGASKRGANPQYKRKDVVGPPPDGVVATPRVRDWRAGEYKPDARMRDAVDRARAEQPGLISLTSKVKP